MENCYGIKKLDYNFVFTRKISSIYAPNGAMKTSFAKAFKDICENKVSEDIYFPERQTKRIVLRDDEELFGENVFVINPYDAEYKSNKMSTLLVNQKLRKQYDDIHLKINEKKDVLINNLKKLSGLKSDIEDEISTSFTNEKGKIFISLKRLENEVLDNIVPEFDDISYKSVFNEKVIGFLETKDFKSKIEDYIKKYDELLDASIYFRKGIFNHTNASVIAKSLSDNGFFQAKHSVSLLSKERMKKEIATLKELEEVIEHEKNTILTNSELVEAFNEIDKKLTANKELRDFRDYLVNNKKIIPELVNIPSFKQKVWISYLKKEKEIFGVLMDIYKSGENEIESIVKQAEKERTRWQNVIDIFNRRFNVPFILLVENQADVILRSQVPSIKFVFKELDERVSVQEHELLKGLSSGEIKALYILNIIFEVEARKEEKIETLFIVDDIADSFDYKNKYAIIEYLKDIAKEEYFYQIILTHNFDFFRTIVGRLGVKKQSFMILKTKDNIEIIDAKYIDPFPYFRENLNADDSIMIASIPFARNIIEYTGNKNNDDYKILTSLLHVKDNSYNVTVGTLQDIFNKVFNLNKTLNDKNRSVVEVIFSKAKQLAQCDGTHVQLENKILLSIAIRLKAEQYVISKILDKANTVDITSFQTSRLIQLYSEEYPDEEDILELLEQVNLMTPENIHINSFMYEPILDMSDDHLRKLFSRLNELHN